MDAVHRYLSQGSVIHRMTADSELSGSCAVVHPATGNPVGAAERGRYTGNSLMPDHLAGTLTSLQEELDLLT